MSLEQRGDKFRSAFRFRGEKFRVNLKATEPMEANGCLSRQGENLRLVERGRLDVPPGTDLGLFLISDGKFEKPVELIRAVRLSELFQTYQTEFTVGAKEVITRAMEDIHMKHLTRLIGGDPLLVAAAHTGGRRSELLRARLEDIDFDAKLVLLREKKRNRDRQTFRTVDMTPFLESVTRKYLAEDHPGDVYAFCSKPNVMLDRRADVEGIPDRDEGIEVARPTRLPCLPAFLRVEPRRRWHRPA